jgi:dihydroorotate dehydrogenase electron transfer subunit
MAGGVELVLHHPQAAREAEPGQFFQLGVEAQQTLLRRPYSVAWTDLERGRIAFIFNVVGAGSAWLAAREAGQHVELLGPLGNGFKVIDNRRPAVCVAGGLGIAGFPALVARLHELRRPVTVLQGARRGEQLLPISRLAGARILQATDDGSTGHSGPVTDLLTQVLTGDAEIFACGPTSMLQSLVRVARPSGFPLAQIQIALEAPMGCGMGTCLGCAAPRAGGGYLLTCQDGPCVSAEKLDWDRVSDAFHG